MRNLPLGWWEITARRGIIISFTIIQVSKKIMVSPMKVESQQDISRTYCSQYYFTGRHLGSSHFYVQCISMIQYACICVRGVRRLTGLSMIVCRCTYTDIVLWCLPALVNPLQMQAYTVCWCSCSPLSLQLYVALFKAIKYCNQHAETMSSCALHREDHGTEEE